MRPLKQRDVFIVGISTVWALVDVATVPTEYAAAIHA